MNIKAVDVTPVVKPVRKFVLELTEEEAGVLFGVCGNVVVYGRVDVREKLTVQLCDDFERLGVRAII